MAGFVWFDWRKLLVKGIELVYIVALDAVVFVAIATIARGVEIALAKLSGEAVVWTFHGYSLKLSDFVQYGDLFTYTAFFLVAAWHVVKWALRP